MAITVVGNYTRHHIVDTDANITGYVGGYLHGQLYLSTGVDKRIYIGNNDNTLKLITDDYNDLKNKPSIPTGSDKLPLAGGTMTGTIVLATGSTTVPPIKMVSGVNLTTPQSGSFEFDGTNLYFTI